MAMKVELTHFDPRTRQYTAVLHMTESEGGPHTYACEGIWQDGQEAMVAGALYDQHKARRATETASQAMKDQIAMRIEAAVAALQAADTAREGVPDGRYRV